MNDDYMYDLIEALRNANDFGDFEPLADLIEQNNLEDNDARVLVAKVLRGEIKLKKDRGERKKNDARRNNKIIRYMYYLKQVHGIPYVGTSKKHKKDCVMLAAEKFNLSEEHIRKRIWNKREISRDSEQLYEKFHDILKSTGHKKDSF